MKNDLQYILNMNLTLFLINFLGVFYADNQAIPPVPGTLLPFGPRNPYLFTGANNQGFGPGKLPTSQSTTGGFMPKITGGENQVVHGVMVRA